MSPSILKRQPQTAMNHGSLMVVSDNPARWKGEREVYVKRVEILE